MFCYRCMKKREGDVCPRCGFAMQKYVSPPQTLPPGTLLKERYLLGVVLGCGGFGITYVGLDQQNGQKVAIKEFFPIAIAQRNDGNSAQVSVPASSRGIFQAGVQKFYQEAALLSNVGEISSVVKVFDFFYENNTAYIIMEYIQGDTVEQIVKRQGPLDLSLTLTIYYPILKTLDAVHRQGVLHRDVSPCNVLLDEQFRPRLIDFGAARVFSSGLSSELSVILKNGFAPVEQYSRKERHGPWEDVYGVSASMYYTLTGKVPPVSTERLVFDTIRPISSFRSDIPVQIERIIMKGLAVQVQDRYRSAAEMIAQIDLAMNEKPAESGQHRSNVSGSYGTPASPSPSRPAGAMVAFGILAVLVFLAALVFVLVGF